MYCSECGEENDKENKYCVKCGSNLQEKSDTENKNSNGNLRLTTSIILFIIGFILFFAVGYYLVPSPNTEVETSEATISFDDSDGKYWYGNIVKGNSEGNVVNKSIEVDGELTRNIEYVQAFSIVLSTQDIPTSVSEDSTLDYTISQNGKTVYESSSGLAQTVVSINCEESENHKLKCSN